MLPTLKGTCSLLVFVGIGLVAAADFTDEFNDEPDLPEDIIRDVYVVDKSPINDSDYTEFVQEILKAKLDVDGQVYVKVAGEEMKLIENADELRNIHLFGHAERIFHNIADVLLMDGVRSNIVLLAKEMKASELGSDTVLALIHTKRVRIDFLTMESRPMNRGTRTKRQSSGDFSVYQQLARASGGIVIHTTKNNIGTVANLLKQAVKSNSVDIMRFTFPGSKVGKRFKIPVDTTMTQMTLQIQTPSARPIVMITTPSGLPVPPTAGHFLGNSLELFEFNMTKTTDYGQWDVFKAGTSDWDVKVTGQSPVDFSYQLMEPGPGGVGMYPIKGRPIGGRRYQMAIKVPNYDKINSVNVLLLLDDHNMPTGVPCMLHNAGGRRGQSMFLTNISIPTLDYRVAIDGMDKNRNQVRRLHPVLISPISVDLVVPPLEGNFLYVNESLVIPFTVINEASKRQTVMIKIEDDRQFAQSPVVLLFGMEGGENRTSHFKIQAGTVAGVTDTVTITAKPDVWGQVTQGQFAIRRITVQERTTTISTTTKSYAPTVTTTTTSGSTAMPTTVLVHSTGTPGKTSLPGNTAAPGATATTAQSTALPGVIPISFAITHTNTTTVPSTTPGVTAQPPTSLSKAGTGLSGGVSNQSGSAGFVLSKTGKKEPVSLPHFIQNLKGLHGYIFMYC